MRPPGPGRRVLGAKRDAALVDLHQAGERLPLRVDHRPAQLAHQQPGRLVAAEAELPSQLPGRDPVPVRRHQPGGQEPGAQAAGGCRAAPSRRSPRPAVRTPRTAGSAARGRAPRPGRGRKPGSGTRPATASPASQRAQAASSGNRASNSGNDRGSSAIPFPSRVLGLQPIARQAAKGMSHPCNSRAASRPSSRDTSGVPECLTARGDTVAACQGEDRCASKSLRRCYVPPAWGFCRPKRPTPPTGSRTLGRVANSAHPSECIDRHNALVGCLCKRQGGGQR